MAGKDTNVSQEIALWHTLHTPESTPKVTVDNRAPFTTDYNGTANSSMHQCEWQQQHEDARISRIPELFAPIWFNAGCKVSSDSIRMQNVSPSAAQIRDPWQWHIVVAAGGTPSAAPTKRECCRLCPLPTVLITPLFHMCPFRDLSG